MAEDAVDDTGVRDKGDDGHAGAASQRVSLEGFPDQPGPGAAGFSGKFGIVPGLGLGSVPVSPRKGSVVLDGPDAFSRMNCVEEPSPSEICGNLDRDPSFRRCFESLEPWRSSFGNEPRGSISDARTPGRPCS